MTLVAQSNIGHDEYVVRHSLRRLATVSRKGTPHPGMVGVEIAVMTDRRLPATAAGDASVSSR
jgi:hypothetical protein